MQVQRIAATLYLVAAVGLLMYGFSAQPRNSVALAFGGVLLALGATRLGSSGRRGALEVQRSSVHDAKFNHPHLTHAHDHATTSRPRTTGPVATGLAASGHARSLACGGSEIHHAFAWRCNGYEHRHLFYRSGYSSSADNRAAHLLEGLGYGSPAGAGYGGSRRAHHGALGHKRPR